MSTPADELRAAATKLRTLSEAALAAPWKATRWHSDTCGSDCDDPSCFLLIVSSPKGVVGDSDVDRADDVLAVEGRPHQQGEADAAYIAAMNPGVGAALADWLDSTAATFEAVVRKHEDAASETSHWVAPALVVARQINGSPQ